MDKSKVKSLFRFNHLPDGPAKQVSAEFNCLAHYIVNTVPESPERTLALRTLWEAKNLAVFAQIEAVKPLEDAI